MFHCLPRVVRAHTGTIPSLQFRRKSFELAKRLMRPYAQLVDAASRDYEWLVSTVER